MQQLIFGPFFFFYNHAGMTTVFPREISFDLVDLAKQSFGVFRLLHWGGFLGPMISDVRDYYIDNVRFPTL